MTSTVPTATRIVDTSNRGRVVFQVALDGRPVGSIVKAHGGTWTARAAFTPGQVTAEVANLMSVEDATDALMLLDDGDQPAAQPWQVWPVAIGPGMFTAYDPAQPVSPFPYFVSESDAVAYAEAHGAVSVKVAA